MRNTKGNIINTARKLIAKNGLKDTTVDEVAKEAKIGKGTIYHYFESKEEMYCTILEQDMAGVKQGLMEAVASEKEPDKKLTAYIAARMRLMKRFSGFYAMFHKDYIDYYSYIKRAYDRYYDFETTNVRDALKDGITKGVFNISDVDFTVVMIVNFIKSMEYQLAMENEQDEQRKSAIIANTIINGIKTMK
ncbi:MAG: TetR/AcrR family transcriptional regulator [Spirochaetia bacterium]|nr:TetR/AcrR family transcriptional regulator [Spirochaetia bacterium]